MSLHKIFLISTLLIISITIGSCKGEVVPPEKPFQTSFKLGVNSITLEHDGLTRELIVQLPTKFQQNKIYPLVFYFHGMNGKKENSQLIFGHIIESEEVVGVFPQGYQGTWNIEENDTYSKADDLGFTLKIIDMIKKEININELQIYTLGYSNGGAFSYFLARRTNKFAAIASLSASFFEGSKIDVTVGRTSVIQISGEHDLWVPYEGGKSAYLPFVFTSAMNSAKLWAVHNGLNEIAVESKPYDKVTLYTFRKEGNVHEVRLYKLHDTGHEIGSHPYIYTSQCNKDIWQFFKEHAKLAY